MEKHLEKRYGLTTAIAMVVGVVIGSGVFFKADDVLKLTNGNLVLALLAWGLGAFSMIFGALVFAEFAQRIEKSNGIVDYSEMAYGKKFGYLVGWFKCVLYFSTLNAIISWVASMYTMILMGSDNPSNSPSTWALAVTYMLIIYLINYFSPMLAGKLQIGSTVIKLIPLALVAIVGIISGLMNNVTANNFQVAMDNIGNNGGTLASAVVATAFAYEGWIAAVTINSEIKDSKKNLPRALIIGTGIIFLVYVMYFLGIASVLPTADIMAQGDNAVYTAATKLFGSTASTILIALVVVSCLGTLNGLVLSTIRIPYSLGIRNQGPFPKQMSFIDPKTKMPTYSVIFAAIVSFIYLGLWYCSINELFGRFIGLDEIPIVMMYGLYILLYIWYIRTFTDLGFVKRYIVPACATIGALIILYGGITNPSVGLYLLVSVIVILLGLFFYRKEEA
ncbi:APC family permease [Clostridium aminobutyricum]|uniref:Amino acid permease n=1 Tax=Clostridium aminobutyricum TaxID=33953 RepID=A0A939D762_CLOAM|nr:amino acid permease [Clostridium aminobutyricum]MBN7772365.1 amino acid permease [Clostridium aminobutyricum]